VFEPRALHLDWASYTSQGLAPGKQAPYPAGHSLQGYLRALEHLQIPYDVVETTTATNLDAYALLILPWPLLIDVAFGLRVVAWVQGGGTLLIEAGLDAFDAAGLYRCPEERPLTRALGLCSAGRRPITDRALPFSMEGTSGSLRAARWIEPWVTEGCEDLAPTAPIKAAVRRKLGRGTVIAIGSFVGLAYWEERYADFETFLRACAAMADALPSLTCDPADGERVHWRFGASGGTALLFIVNEGPAVSTRWRIDRAASGTARRVVDLICGDAERIVNGEFTFELAAGSSRVLRFEEETTP
jgi:beta-galactosidase